MPHKAGLCGAELRFGLAVRANGRFADGAHTACLVRGVAAVGIALRLAACFLLLAALGACGKMSDETVREKDQERIDVSKNMPGSNVAPDPADVR